MSNQIGIAANNFTQTMSTTIKFTADNDAGTAAVSKVPLSRGTGVGSTAGLPAGVTMSGDYTVFEELQNAFRDKLIRVNEIVLESDTTTHFTGNRAIEMFERMFNGKEGPVEQIKLNRFKDDSGAGVSTTCTIPRVDGKEIVINPWTVITLEVLKASSLSVTLHYDFEQRGKVAN